MSHRRCTAAFGVCLGLLSAVSRAAQPAAVPRIVSQPCSLGKVCRELSRRFRVSVSATPDLLETRVVWSFGEDRTLGSTLAALAELTGSRVVNTGTPEKPRLRLERKRSAAVLEEAWRREALLRTLREVMRAADQQERGKLDVGSFSPGIQFTLKREPEKCLYIRLLRPELIDRLLAGEKLRFPPGSVSEAAARRTAERVFGADDPVDGPAQPRVEACVRSVREQGVGLQIELGTPRGSFLSLELGRGVRTVLCHFSDEELGLANTHANPYRLLESGRGQRAALPAALQRPLPADVRLPSDHLWHSALREFARVSGLSLVSDGHFARPRSRLWSGGPIMARRGTSLAEALDALCEPFRYLWWERDGTVYLRARAWMWDRDSEPPDRFLDTWWAAVERKKVGAPQLAALAALSPRQFTGLRELGWNSYVGSARYGEAILEFAALLAGSPPAEQARLLGSGLTFSPEQAKTMQWLFLQTTAGRGAGPGTLRLDASVAPSARNPGALKVTLALIRKWSNKTDPMEFEFDLPEPSDPFAAGKEQRAEG